MLNCHFCSQIEGRPEHDLIARMLPDLCYVRRVMMETRRFALIPSLGPLAPGHVLLCPKWHVHSFAELDETGYAEFLSFKQEVCTALEAAYGPELLWFEHGMAASGGRIPCSIDHAHQHVVPLRDSPELKSLLASLAMQPFDGSRAELLTCTAGNEYIQVELPDRTKYVATRGTEGFESQWMRRFVADRFGTPTRWNWREYPEPMAAHASWQHLVSDLAGPDANALADHVRD
jgi:diadenosine tetraphosphate (Ap4A) HIT family hydrolase